jgi:stringent starvation protein B
MSLPKTVFNTIYQHIANSGGIVYLMVNTKLIVNSQFAPYAQPDGNIVLNISMSAVGELNVYDDGISLTIRFRGIVVTELISWFAISVMYDHKNTNVGINFNAAFWNTSVTPSPDKPTVQPTAKVVPISSTPPRKRPNLTLVK